MKILLKLIALEIKLLFRNKSSIFWMFAFPVVLFLILTTAFGDGKSFGKVDIAIVNMDQDGSYSKNYENILATALQASGIAGNLRQLSDPMSLPREKEILIEIPLGFNNILLNEKLAKVFIQNNGANALSAKAVGDIVGSVNFSFSLNYYQKPLAVSLSKRATAKPDAIRGYDEYIITGVLLMIALSTALIDFPSAYAKRKESGSSEWLKAKPVFPLTPVLAMLISRLLGVALSSAVLVMIASSYISLEFTAESLLSGALILFVWVCTFFMIGLCVSEFTHTSVVATQVGNAIYFPLLFLGNTLFPVSGFPNWMRQILKYSPVNAGADHLRAALSGKLTPNDDQVIAMLLVLGIVACVMLVKFSIQKKGRS